MAGGTTVSLAPGASLAVVGGSTQTLEHTAPSPVVGSLVFGGSTYTANSASQFVIGGQTLVPNEQITVSGTPISLAPGASLVVIASSTQALGSATFSVTPPTPVVTPPTVSVTPPTAEEGGGGGITIPGMYSRGPPVLIITAFYTRANGHSTLPGRVAARSS